MKSPIIFRRNDTLTLEESSYWKDLLYRVVKIGTELEIAPPKGMKREKFEDMIRQALSPSGNVNQLGMNGVWDVQPEHCGVELRIIGRQPNFRSLQKQYSQIMLSLLKNGSRPRSTCGLHFHILTPNLAEPVPQIIMANLWNLVRKYAPELRLITSCGDKREALCRRRNHTSHKEMMLHSPGTMSMREIQEKLKESQMVPEHQNFLNLEHLKFTEDGDISEFHLEFRFPDAHLSATALTSQTFLFLALLLKAVDLSQYGVIHVGKIQPWRRKIAILDMLSNNDGNLSTSDTSAVSNEIVEELRQGTYELLDLLTPTFERFKNNYALDVLSLLAETPISLMRCDGYDWDNIESCLIKQTQLEEIDLDKVDKKLMQSLEFSEWVDYSSLEAWKEHVARELFLSYQDLEIRLNKIESYRGLRWNAKQGKLVFRD